MSKKTRSDVDALEAAASDTDARINNLEIATVRVQGYTALRAYTGQASIVRITASGVAGCFRRDDASSSADNGGTIIVDALGRSWVPLPSLVLCVCIVVWCKRGRLSR